jgi:hypothetical protein
MNTSEAGIGWKEVYLRGCQFAEAELLRQFIAEIQNVQAMNRAKAKCLLMKRAFHAKIHAGIGNAEFRILSTIPKHLRIGFIQPEKTYRAIVRFSNASGLVQPDTAKD